MQGFLESAVATGGRAAGRSVTGGEVLGALAVCEVWRAVDAWLFTVVNRYSNDSSNTWDMRKTPWSLVIPG